MLKIVGFVILATSSGSGKTIPTDYDGMTGSQSGVIASKSDCEIMANKIYESSGRNINAFCAPVIK